MCEADCVQRCCPGPQQRRPMTTSVGLLVLFMGAACVTSLSSSSALPPPHQRGVCSTDYLDARITTFNLLAPCYKRLTDDFTASPLQITWGRRRESSDYGLWTCRTEALLDFMETLVDSDLICCQEFWFHPEFVERFEDRFGSRFQLLTVRRTGDKADGAATLVRLDGRFQVTGHTSTGLGSTGDRIGQLVVLRPRTPTPASMINATGEFTGRDSWLDGAHQHAQDEERLLPTEGSTGAESTCSATPDRLGSLLLLNTHLSFPHTAVDEQAQRQQIQAATAFLERERASRGLALGTPQLVVGDLNVEDQSSVCQHLRANGFVSCFSNPTTELCPPAQAMSSSRRVTHLNHLGQAVGVDHIFVKVPDYGVDVLHRVVEPPHLPCDTWPGSLSHISDHRPLTASVRIGLPPVVSTTKKTGILVEEPAQLPTSAERELTAPNAGGAS